MPSWIYTLILIGLLSGGGFLYFKYTQNELAELNQTIATKDATISSQASALATNELTIQQLRKEIVEKAEAQKKLQEKLQYAERNQDHLLKVLQSHDLTGLAKAKPGLIERRINDATKKVFEDLESTTGKQPTDQL